MNELVTRYINFCENLNKNCNGNLLSGDRLDDLKKL